MPFSLYSVNVLSGSRLLYGLFAKTAAFFFFPIYSNKN